MSDEKKCKMYCCGHFLQGLGAFCAGIAAIIALLNTGDVLKEVLKIQEQSVQIKHTLDRLESFLITENAVLAVTRLSKNVTPEEAINHIPLSNTELKAGQVFLPSAKRDLVVEALSKENIPESEKIKTLENALEIKK